MSHSLPNTTPPTAEAPQVEEGTREEENRLLRQELWLRHGCPFPALYGDDGEMSCNACMIDFKRGDVVRIIERLKEQGLARARSALAQVAPRVGGEAARIAAMEGALDDAADLLDEYVPTPEERAEGHKMALAETLREYAKFCRSFTQ